MLIYYERKVLLAGWWRVLIWCERKTLIYCATKGTSIYTNDINRGENMILMQPLSFLLQYIHIYCSEREILMQGNKVVAISFATCNHITVCCKNPYILHRKIKIITTKIKCSNSMRFSKPDFYGGEVRASMFCNQITKQMQYSTYLMQLIRCSCKDSSGISSS